MPACPVPIRRLAAALLAIALLGAGCGGDDGETASSTSTADNTSTSAAPSPPEETTTSMATTTAPLSDEEAILAAVDGYWRTVRAANDPPNPDHPDIERFAADPARQVLVSDLTEKVELGHAVRLPDQSLYEHRLSLVEQHDDLAIVQDCGIDDTIRYIGVTGEVLNDSIVTNLMRIVVIRSSGGQWIVSEVIGQESWQGVAGCALD